MTTLSMSDTSQNNYAELRASADAESEIPLVAGVPMVEVVAPATLSEGYTFKVQVGDDEKNSITVTVPKGGVAEGQKFMVPASSNKNQATDNNNNIDNNSNDVDNVPGGQWKDGLCNCCTYGCCHPMCCLAYWCTPFALAQVMTRVNLNWCGSPGSVSEVSSTFGRLVVVYVLYFVLQMTLNSVAASYRVGGGSGGGGEGEREGEQHTDVSHEVLLCQLLGQCLSFAYGVYVLVLILRTRAQIRRKYAIPERTCHGCEDCCCAFWCGVCTTCQMARHTGNYDENASQCCTRTGLPSGAEIPPGVEDV